tara:strand:- start:126 stop:377 length:252 start_codon:yes stop_codon:yes gene_type:complete
MAALFKRKDSNATLDEPHDYSKDKGQSARPRMSVLWRSVHVMTGMVPQHRQSATLAGPQLGSYASLGRAWWLWATRHRPAALC